MNGTQLASRLFRKVAPPNNGSDFSGKIYVFRPLNPQVKLTLMLFFVAIATMAFGGNVLVLLFMKTKDRTTSFLKACDFQKNFNFYIKSLATSDVLASAIPIPYLSVNLYLDFLQRGWPCKIGRYVIFLFPCVTGNNLLVVTFGKYLATRQVPRTLSIPTVRRVVLIAWLAGLLSALFPAATMNGVRYDLNETHYTVICKYDNTYLPFRIVFATFTILQYIMPCCILIIINISLIKTLWRRTKRTVDIQKDNAIKLVAKTARYRAVYIVIVLSFAFVTPYFGYFVYVIYNMVAQPDISFETDQIIRTANTIIVYTNSAFNPIIYFVQMKDFRAFLKEKLLSRFLTKK